MYIKNLKIRGLKKFKKLEIEFNDKLNILIGENEEGKSTVIEAIDILINQKYKNADKSILEELFNIDNVEEYKKNRNYSKLPEIYIEAEIDMGNSINNMNYTGLDYLENKNDTKKTGFYFKCKINDEYKDEITDIIKSGSIPYDCYTMEWKTFAGKNVLPLRNDIKYVGIDTSNSEAFFTYNTYNKSIFSSRFEGQKRIRIKNEFNSKIDNLIDGNDPNFKIDDTKRFGVNRKKIILENIINIKEQGIPLENKGSGMENYIKTSIALEKSNKVDIISIEEPENHLSYVNLRRMIDQIINQENEAQIIITTHNSLIVNNLSLNNVIFIHNSKSKKFNDLSSETIDYFKKADNSKVLEFILANKVILVEGNSEYILLPKIYENTYGNKIEKDNISLISVDGLNFEHYVDIAKSLNKKVAIITDNDKDEEKIENFENENSKNDNIKYFIEEDKNNWTFEASLLNYNEDILNEKFFILRKDAEYKYNGQNVENRILGYMLNHKTKVAIKIYNEKIYELNIPEYIKEAFEWIRK